MRFSSDEAKRGATNFFSDVDGKSESSDSPVPAGFPDYNGLLELNEGHNWGLDELELAKLRSEHTKSSMQSFRAKLTEFHETCVFSVTLRLVSAI